MTVYWANSIFSEADRSFNAASVERVRSAGIAVLSPQEQLFNQLGHKANAATIFKTDTAMIAACDTLVACIDQETIDCGVACEIGIAWALGMRIIGLYTDFRQYRQDDFRMYKNPYLVGCIQDRGLIVNSVDALIQELLA